MNFQLSSRSPNLDFAMSSVHQLLILIKSEDDDHDDHDDHDEHDSSAICIE
jgi:hypothetical protein